MIENKEIKNASWIIICKIIQSCFALVINMLTARYLGPSNYGTIHYATSLVLFVTPFMQLGLNSILVREIVNHPQKEGAILGTSIIMSVCSAFLCILGVITFTCIVNVGETETIWVCGLYSLLLVFQAVELIQYWFQAKLMSKYTSVVMLVAYFFVATYRISLLVTKQSIYWFAVTNALDYFLIATALLVLYQKLGAQRLSFSWSLAKELFVKGKYFILSSLMVTIFSQTDRIMLKLMIDESSTGYYSAAVSCALLSNFVFTAILDSARPSIFESKKNSQESYERKIILLFSIIIFLSLLQSIIMTLFASFIVNVLYGESFAATVNILQLTVWYTTFSYIGAVRSVWILAEGKQKYLLIINLSGALTNIILNFLLIPQMGAMGAALATLLTQFVTNVVVVQMIPAIKQSNYLMFCSLNPRYLIKGVKTLIKKA